MRRIARQFLLNHKKTLIAFGAVLLIPVTFAMMIGVRQLTAEYREKAEGWELQGVSDDGRVLTVGYITTPSCQSLDRVEKTETATEVALRVVVRHQLTYCATEDRGVYHTTKVELGRPLGDRELVDARTGRDPELFRSAAGAVIRMAFHTSRSTAPVSVGWFAQR